MFYDNILTGLGIHIINFLVIIFIIIFSKLSLKEKNVLQSLTLLIIVENDKYFNATILYNYTDTISSNIWNYVSSNYIW